MSTQAVSSSAAIKFHVSLHAADLARSSEFFRVLFGREPAKQRADYAKFELDEPPLVLSLISGPHAAGGALNHVGIRLADAAALFDVQSRLESAGWQTQREEGVDCCHSRQTKFWVSDPDGVLWEFYFLHDDSDEESEHPAETRAQNPMHISRTSGETTGGNVLGAAQPTVAWQHLLGQPLPTRIEHADASVERVDLEGTFNLKLEPRALASFLTEVHRILRPGGQVFMHGLCADAEFPGPLPKLPGPAAVVEHVPQVSDVGRFLTAAGFVSVEFTKLSEQPSLVAGSVEMRELRAKAVKPWPAAGDCQSVVMYRGPPSSTNVEPSIVEANE